MAKPVSTMNEFLVTTRGGQVVQQHFQPRMSREQALNLAAWLIVMADGCFDYQRAGDEGGPPTGVKDDALDVAIATVRAIEVGRDDG